MFGCQIRIEGHQISAETNYNTVDKEDAVAQTVAKGINHQSASSAN